MAAGWKVGELLLMGEGLSFWGVRARKAPTSSQVPCRNLPEKRTGSRWATLHIPAEHCTAHLPDLPREWRKSRLLRTHLTARAWRFIRYWSNVPELQRCVCAGMLSKQQQVCCPALGEADARLLSERSLSHWQPAEDHKRRSGRDNISSKYRHVALTCYLLSNSSC